MKKLFVILLTLALMITLIGNVSASTNLNVNGGGTTDVQYQVSPTYQITVPPGFSFSGSNDVVQGWVNATNLRLEAGTTVTVDVTSQYGGKMFTHNAQGSPVGAGLNYTLSLRDYPSGDGNFREVSLSNPQTPAIILTYEIPSGDNVETIEKRIELKFVLEDITRKQNLLSGTYTDTLTFTASYSGDLDQ